MNPQIAAIERRLRRARLRWGWFRLIRWTCLAGWASALALILWGTAILGGLIKSKALALDLLVGVAAMSLLAWLAGAVCIALCAPARGWLARAFERINPRLEDRINTLVFLRDRGPESPLNQFVPHIAEQAEQLLNRRGAPAPFSPAYSLAWFAGLWIPLGGVFWLNLHFAPLEHLRKAPAVAQGQGGAGDSFGERVLTNTVEQNPAWGEVRVTDPGRDLKVTKVDVVPLAIEAAANRDLKSVAWCSSINGGPERPHPLPAPTDPHYAAYRPTIDLDELKLADWDVLTYYAQAQTADSNSYASDLYFVEIRPFREDIQKLPGGAGGQAYQTLNEISSLIGHQQQVIRDTHQHVQRPPAQEKARQSARDALASAEEELSDAARHLYAEMAANLENKPIGAALDNLAKAEGALKDAGGLLRKAVMTEAQEQERAALADLVGVRKIFQKAVSDHPGDFAPPNPQTQSGLADDSAQKLNEMAEFRDEAKSAQEFVEQTARQQKQLEQQARSGPADSLAGAEAELGTNLDQFAGQHPQPFKGAEKELQGASRSLREAAEQLRQQASAASGATQGASQSLQKLQHALQGQAAQQRLADAYRLKQMLEQEIRALGQAQNPTNGSLDNLSRVARAAQDTVDQLKKSVEQQSRAGALGRPLQEALNATNKAELDSRLERLQQAQTPAQQRKEATAAQAGLEQLNRAFAASEPKSLRSARQMNELNQQTSEAAAALAQQAGSTNLLNIDPVRLPPAYRSRIEKYFQRLSESSAR